MSVLSGYINIPETGDGRWKSPVATAFDLPTNGNQLGDVRLAIDTDILYTWNGTAWVEVVGGGTLVFSDSIVNTGGIVTLVNDSASPAPLQYYGTDNAGVLGYHTGVQGPPGTPGSVWYNGAGVPSNGLGTDGDYYLQTSNGDVWFKVSGAWT